MKTLTQRLNEVKNLNYFLIFFLTLCNTTLSFAQTSNNGLLQKKFKSEKGIITVNLPADVRAGDVISGTVNIEAYGKNENKRLKNTKELNGYVVEVANQPMTAGNYNGTWTMPGNNRSTNILLKDAAGKVIASSDPIVFDSSPAASFNAIQIPSYIVKDKSVIFPGNFDGQSVNTELRLNDIPATILAESPRGIVVLTTDASAGSNEVSIYEDGDLSTGECNVLEVDLYADDLNLQRGQSTELKLEVKGLQGVEEPTVVEIINKTPHVISMNGGTNQEMVISPKAISPDGTMVHLFRVTAKVIGGFSVYAGVLPSTNFKPSIPASDDPTNPFGNDRQASKDDDNDGLTDNHPVDKVPTYVSMETQMKPNGVQEFVSGVFATNILATVTVVLTDAELRRLRNKARGLPENTPVEDSDPNDKDVPYSRPVPDGLKEKDYERGSYWKDPEALLKKAKSEVKRAQEHKGKIKPGIPGFGTIGLTSPNRTISHHSRGCTEYIYNFAQRYDYINDVTLVKEEQLSPSFEYFVAKGENKINITSTTTGWEIGGSVTAGIKGVEIGISGKYGESTTKITGNGTSKLQGRHLWLFHIGRLYLTRKAYLLINYEYHYEVCEDGSTSNWVVVTYSDHWFYRYFWVESLEITYKDNEGNFHKIKDIWLGSDTIEEEHESYEVDGLERENFDNPDDWDFFPEVQ